MNGPGDPNQGYPPHGAGYPPPHGQPGHGYPPGQPYPPPGYPPQRGGNNTALLVTLIVLVVAAIAGGAILYFTGAFGGNQSSNASANVAPVSGPGVTTPTTTSQPVTPSTSTPAAGGQNVAALLQIGVSQMQSQLPIRNGPATITAVSSAGTVLTMEMTINQPISPAEFDQAEDSFRQNICAGQFRNAISQGASARVVVTDSVGNSRTYVIASC